MRLVVLLLYMISIIPLPGISTTLCVSGGDVAFEGLHIPEATLHSECSHEIDISCDFTESHHSHGDCYDYENAQVRERSKTFKAPVAIIERPLFEQLFAEAPFRAPPAVSYEHHELPFPIRLRIVETTVFRC